MQPSAQRSTADVLLPFTLLVLVLCSGFYLALLAIRRAPPAPLAHRSAPSRAPQLPLATTHSAPAPVRPSRPRTFIAGQHPTEVRVSHLLISFAGADRAPPNVTRTRPAAHAMIEALLGRLRAGEEFAGLARRFSDSPDGRVRGGDLGYVRRGMMVPEFERAAFSLQAHTLSEIVETQFGFHVIRCDDVRPLTQ